MARWLVRFQIQTGSKQLDGETYHSDKGPCTAREAEQKLAVLWAKNKDYYQSPQWNPKLKEAIDKAVRAVKSGHNASASINRNFYSTTFEYDKTTYRVDVAIEAGSGHFN